MCLNSKPQLEGTGSKFQKSVGVAKAKLCEGESWAGGVAGKSNRTSGVERAPCKSYCIFSCVYSFHSAGFNLLPFKPGDKFSCSNGKRTGLVSLVQALALTSGFPADRQSLTQTGGPCPAE